MKKIKNQKSKIKNTNQRPKILNFTRAPAPPSCFRKKAGGTVRGFAPRRNPEAKGATAVKPWGSTLPFCILIFAFCILHFVTGCGKRAPKEIKKIPVSAVEVKRGELKEFFYYVGDIKAKDEAIVYPKVSGKVAEKLIKEGSSVNKSDIIAYIDRDEVGFQFEKAPVESPIGGVLGKLYVDIGENVTPQTGIAFVVDMNEMRVKVNIIEREVPKIKEGQHAEIKVDAYPQDIFEGVIDSVSPVIDLASRTSSVEIKIPNSDHRLRPGMFARIKILINDKKDALIIPKDAIVKEDSTNYVFVVKETNKVRRQKIEIGISEGDNIEVTSVLNEGEFVVTMGNVRLKDGDVVEIIK